MCKRVGMMILGLVGLAGLTACNGSIFGPQVVGQPNGGKGQPPALTSGQRQTDRGEFGQAAGGDAPSANGVPSGAPVVALFEQRAGGAQGLIAAAWSDGTIVFASRVDAPGIDLKIGRTDSERVSRVLELCGSAGVGTKPAAVPGAGAPQRAVGIRIPGGATTSKAWLIGAPPPPEEADAVNSCEFCAARTIALIPFDGGRGFSGTREWAARVEMFARTGKWDESPAPAGK